MRDQLDGYAAGRFATFDEVGVHWAEVLERNGLTMRPDKRKVRAYVNEGRWVADCPHCGAGMLCAAANPATCCLGCGRVFSVTWPKRADEAVALLEVRPVRNQNWNIDEPVDALRNENALMAHELAV